MSSQNIEAGITLGATSIGAGVGAVFGGLPGAAMGSGIGQTVGNTIGVFIKDDKPKNKFTLSMTKGDPYAGYRLGDVERDYSFKKSITDGNNSLANTMNAVTTLGTAGLQVANLANSLTSQNDFKTVLKKPDLKGTKIEENMAFVDKNISMEVPKHLNSYYGLDLSKIETTPLYKQSFQLQPTVKLEGNESVIYKNNNRIGLK